MILNDMKHFINLKDIKTKDLKKKIVSLDLSSKRKIILVSIKKEIKSWELEN